MSLKNVVKVMNFHSLLRVDRSRRSAKKYAQMEDMLLEMMDNILHNRNILIDQKVMKIDGSKPSLAIFLGGDMGFCGNLNNLVRKSLASIEAEEDAHGTELVIIGKKLASYAQDASVYMTREDFAADNSKVLALLYDTVRKKTHSEIRLVYNYYRNTSTVEFMDRVIYPMPEDLFKGAGERSYQDDFVFEGDPDAILYGLIEDYLQYELEIATQVSYAAENITRQNITTESLKKIDESEETAAMRDRRDRKDKEFAKVLDNYTKINNY